MDSARYGTPPAPPPLSTGSVPAQRLSTQIPQYNMGEAPACVQNAMMTKDKKPFTYTPGGIDLSQIKSQRMAKRLARNAQSEGATGQQQMNRPSPSPQQSNGSSSPAAHLGATAMGMPFQVLPTGPPPPPPQPNKGGAPPPPPPAPQNKLAPQSNGNAARKSPTPQNFEPPPMGFRPEIKIPPNPMATLKKVPPPQEKNNFWMEEYRKERSKSPMVGNDENDNNRSSPNNPQPETNQYAYNNYNNTNTSQQNDYNQQPQQSQYRSPSPQSIRQQPESYTQRATSPAKPSPFDLQRRNEGAYQTQYSPQAQQQSPPVQRQPSQFQSQVQPPTPQQSSPQQQSSPFVQRQQSFPPPQQYQGPTPPQYQQPQQTSLPSPQQPQQLQQKQQQQQPQQQQQQQQQTVPWRSQRPVAIQNNVTRPREVMSPAPSESPRPQPQQQQQPQYPAYLRAREAQSPAPELQPPQMSQPYQQKNSQVGSIYIPPLNAQQQQQQSPPQQNVRQQQPTRQAPVNRWVSPPQPAAETQPINRIKSPPPASSNGFGSTNNTGLRLQINTTSSNAKERIIPIQLEQTPTPTRTPSAPGFGPQPFYNANQQQYSSVPSPPLAHGATSNGQNSPSYIVRSPNQFVDQGYNNYPPSQDPNRVTSPTMQQMQSPRNTAGGVKTRIVPINMDMQSDGPLNPNNVRGPISQQPLVIQNDPRNQNSWGSGSSTPVQSKSFRILQKITDTTDDAGSENRPVESDNAEQEPQLQRPTYARQMTPGQANSPTVEQMKRMQLNQDNDKNMNCEDPRYRGPSNPSKTFKKLQGAIERCSPSRSDKDRDGNSPVMKQPQPNRYANQRPVYSPEEQTQQYVHPSEQQVPEPKKYTGSAIPSRSFKILQAMTTPENAAEMEGSEVVESNNLITEYPYQQAPGPIAYPYPCCLPPPHLSPGGDIQNWQYPPPPPHHLHHHHHHHMPPHQHHPYPPCPCYYYYPPNEYDSQNFSQYRARDSFSRGNSQSQDLPNIVITPSAEDIPKVREKDFGRDQREGSVIEELSRRLSEISSPLKKNISQDDNVKFVVDSQKNLSNSPSNQTSIKSDNENDQMSEDSSDDLLTSSSEASTTSNSEDCAEQLPNDGLKAIKSVTNIQVYNKRAQEADDDDHTVADGESFIYDVEEEEEEEELVADELEFDEEGVVEEIESNDEDDVEELDEDEEVVIMDDLSVIYEENEADAISPRPRSRVSSSVSDSTTIANEEEEVGIKVDDDEDNSNSVTVRLPLKFSFSRSSNDENIATVEVGSSQIEDKRRSFSIASVEADPDEYDSDPDCDVSVTISLSPSSGSFERKSSLSPVPRRFEAAVKEESYESEADDISVSFSVPMRNKFAEQDILGDDQNNACEKTVKKSNLSSADSAVEAWRRSSSEATCDFAEESKSSSNHDILEYEFVASKNEDNIRKSAAKMKNEQNQIEEQKPKPNEDEELDFWATLQATRKEAQLFLEKTADYWGKKIDGREKEKPTAEALPTEGSHPAEDNVEDDFWANIRVKKNDEQETIKEEKVAEDKKPDPETKSPKPKKKKKKVVKAPEKEAEPEHVWSTISLPKANNRAKIVESTIKMIQDKTKKSKEVVKPATKEIEVGDFIASIKENYDKEPKSLPVKPIEDPVSKKTSSEKKTSQVEKIETVLPSITKKQNEDIRSNLVKEKAELKKQIMEQKFAKVFTLPNKPVLMQATLSEAESETHESVKVGQKWEFSTKISTTIAYEKSSSVLTTPEVEIVIEESEKVDKPKKKVKKVVEANEGDTLKLPKAKAVKKSTKEPKKLKKKKQDVEDVEPKFDAQKETPSVIIEDVSDEKTFASYKQEGIEETSAVIVEVVSNGIETEETDFWAEIESSNKDDEDADLWAAIEASKASFKESCEQQESWKETELPKIEETPSSYEKADFWTEDDSSELKKDEEKEEPIEEIDIWAQIESAKAEQIFETRTKIETKASSTDFWSEIESSKSHLCEESVDSDFWSSNSKRRESSEEQIDFWADIKPCNPEMDIEIYKAEICEPEDTATEKLDFINEATSRKTFSEVNEEISIVKTNSVKEKKIKKKLQSSEAQSKVEEPMAVEKTKSKKKTSSLEENSARIVNVGTETKQEHPPKNIELIVEAKPKTKKKSLMSKEDLLDPSAAPLKRKSKKKSPPVQVESTEIDFWAQIESSEPKVARKAVSSLHVYGNNDIEFINLTPNSTYYAVYTTPEMPVHFWATTSYVDEEIFPTANTMEEKETDFWASNSSGNETEVNSEVDTGKIDFWVTQRKFETRSGFDRETSPKREEEPEEIDFWAEIKGPNADEDEVNAIVPKEECEVRRNNYKKAMAFFTNTVNVEKKEEKQIDSPLIAEDDKTPEAKPFNSWSWRRSEEQECEAPEEREVNDVFLIIEDNETEDEPDTLIENSPYEMEEGFEFEAIEEEQPEEEEDSSESISDSTPNHFEIEHQYPIPEPEPIKPREKSVTPISNKLGEEIKISVKDRIFAFETGAVEPPPDKPKTSLIVDSATPKSNLSRNSSQRSESEIEEDDSGVTDMNKLLSETDTESESFPELRKMSRYQRASTHSRLFKLLQDEGDVIEEEQADELNLESEFNFKPRKKIVHNVSITRKQNPKALQDAESMTQRRQRLSLPLHKNSSIDADNLSSPNSPASPIFGQPQSQAVSDQLVNELVQSLLLKKSSSNLKNLPMEKLQAAAKRVLEEELDSLENTSLDSTPALTPQEFKNESYSDYYDSWSAKTDSDNSANSFEILPSKAFKVLQETTASAKKRPWAVRCPRVLSSKTVNRDLARVTESPEIFSRSSNSPEISFSTERAGSIGRWRKV